jgi:2-methylisocitrate lyase-like PEP mutase family enzyme
VTTTRHEQARAFLERHREDGCFLVPNAWDVGSARLLDAVGFPAIATTSAGVAFSLGRPDHGYHAADVRVDRDTMIERVRSMAAAISVPLSADLEAGYGEAPEAVAETIALAIAAGAAGGNIEDYTGRGDRPLFDPGLAVDRIRAAREVVDRSGVPFVLVGRTDALLVDPGGLAECVRRGNALREAGADCVFVPGAADADTIATLAREIDAPINVVMGLAGKTFSMDELAGLGVRRVTIGGSLARAVYHQIWEAARELRESGTFRFAERQLAQSELNRIFDK